jgi:predicted Zn finger-like uncharacterized protein
LDTQGNEGVMIKVSCPSCNASYDVDENRLPDSGLRMRCPKCAESFQVHHDGSVAKSGGGKAPAAQNPPQRKPTQVGLGPSVSAPIQRPASSSASDLDADLPRPLDDVDLPAPRSGDDFADPPPPGAGGRPLGLDLFADDAIEDLPAPKGGAPSPGFDPFADLDLPAPLDGSGGADLPAPLSSRAVSDIDLPAPMRGGQARAVHAMSDEVDLPMALTDAELPRPMAPVSSVPEPLSLDSELPVGLEDQDLPVARDDFADIDAEGPAHAHEGGPIELDLPDGEDLDLDMDLGAPAQPPAQPPPIGQPFGAPGAAPTPAGDRISRDSAELEFSELGSQSNDVVRMPHPGGAGPEVPVAPDAPKRPRAVKRPAWLFKAAVALAVLAVVGGVGFYSGTTKYGLFGMHLVEPFLPGAGDELVVAQAIESAELVASADTYVATQDALAQLASARESARLNRSLIARSLLHESYYQIRYGQDAESAATADSLRLHLQRRGDEAPRIHVALAADALRNADDMTAASEIARAATENPTDTYVDLVAGEAALRQRDGKAAVDAFGRALAKHESARAYWGIARGHMLLGQREEALTAAQKTLKTSPYHAAARVAVAAQLVSAGELEEATQLLEAPAGLGPVDGKTLQVARSDRSAALAMIARIEEQGGRLGAAREMYEKAIELDSSNASAALGAARLVLLEGVYPDALARFQTVLGSTVPPGAEMDPTGKPRVVVEAKLGAAEALLAMNKAEDAKKVLIDLDTPEPVNPNVEIWLGKTAAALGETRDAVRHFRNAIELEPSAIGAYIALAKHYSETKRPSEAVAVLVEAQKNVEITAEVRRLLGWAELQRGELDSSIKQFQAAIEEEPRDPSSVFGLAQAYRRKRMFEEAARALDKVAALDAKFPNLQLERGRLAEARGDTEAAIAGYRAALDESPNEVALKSRLGAAMVLTGKLDEAAVLLQEVLKVQPYSAEAEHYLGRVELERGQIEASQRRFQRAVRLEPENATYRMYVAWAALESNEMTPALREIEAALKLDPNLGDAYWLRARIRIRAGVVRDALADLKRALELNPNRIEAWAAMGECHYQLGQVKEAIADFEKAVAGQPDQAYWWYRLGRLQLDEGLRTKALTSLSTSVSLGDEEPARHGWLADAHRLIGDIHYAQKRRQDAVIEYGRYLELADRNAIDRADVETKLQKISQGAN